MQIGNEPESAKLEAEQGRLKYEARKAKAHGNNEKSVRERMATIAKQEVEEVKVKPESNLNTDSQSKKTYSISDPDLKAKDVIIYVNNEEINKLLLKRKNLVRETKENFRKYGDIMELAEELMEIVSIDEAVCALTKDDDDDERCLRYDKKVNMNEIKRLYNYEHKYRCDNWNIVEILISRQDRRERAERRKGAKPSVSSAPAKSSLWSRQLVFDPNFVFFVFSVVGLISSVVGLVVLCLITHFNRKHTPTFTVLDNLF
jgi:hypothetical protein